MHEMGSGTICAELTSADMTGTLDRIAASGMEITQVQHMTDLTIRFQIPATQYPGLTELAEKTGCTLNILGKQGIRWRMQRLAGRKLLVGGMLLLLLATWVVPGRILIVEVTGNENVPVNRILEAAAESGIAFGVSAREVRSEKMKNTLLSAVPELQWAGVNTYGSRAVITVRERKPEEPVREESGASSIVSDRDGVILSATATSGSLQVVPGQVVQAGQTLISGLVDCGIKLCTVRAEGEILAATDRSLTVKIPAQRLVRAETEAQIKKYSLIIGKNRINFFKGSGISEGSCVKMYSEYVLTLPGGWPLPLRIAVQTVAPCRMLSEARGPEAETELTRFAERYLCSRMIAGSVTDRTETVRIRGDALVLTGRYACQEMIGRVKAEEIGVYHGKTD